MQEVQAFISLGSNLGDKELNLQKAVELISTLPDTRIQSLSSIYFTEPQGMAGQPFFANQVVQLACGPNVEPTWLLDQLLQIEQKMGRVRDENIRYSSRTIDLDLLLFGNVQCSGQFLTLPHPRMHERAFVLVPLLEIADSLVLPSGETLQECLAKLTYTLQDKLILQ